MMVETKTVPETLQETLAVLEKAPFLQSLKNFETFCVTRGFSTVSTTAPPLVPILSQTNPVHTAKENKNKRQ
jgi:hypothetical protein